VEQPQLISQLTQYVPVLMLVVLAVGFAFGMLAVSVLIGKAGRRSRSKDTPYECGMVPVGEGNTRLSIKFYLVAMLFILFDIEVLFFYPWAVLFWDLKWFGLIQIGIFTLLLIESYVYVWKKGALEWE
jgi:NADH-quinone oxidoreductase subunit A